MLKILGDPVLGSFNLKLIDTWYTYLEWALLSVVYSEFSCVFCVLCCCCDTLVREGIESHCSGACSLFLYCAGSCPVGCFCSCVVLFVALVVSLFIVLVLCYPN